MVRVLIVMVSLLVSLSAGSVEGKGGAWDRGGPGSKLSGHYLIVLEGTPLDRYAGDLPGLAPTRMARGKKIDPTDQKVRAYRQHLNNTRNRVVGEIGKKVGRSLEVRFAYDLIFFGLSAKMDPAQAREVAKIPGVVSVRPAPLRKLHTDTSPAWIRATDLWSRGAGISSQGEGMVVGIIDSGINPENPAFLATGDDGYTHTNPKGRYYGVCDGDDANYEPGFPCNSKLIGAYDLIDGNDPLDVQGHGSHTASIAAGNKVDLSDSQVPDGEARRISGVAPHANIISYRVCNSSYCPEDAVLAAIEQAILDGVDVINYSIGQDNEADPWSDASGEAIPFLRAIAAGISVAVSAGNNGSDSTTISSPANTPWLTAVGNTTINAGSDDFDSVKTSSSRGPATLAPGVIKPDLSAPGTDILAAVGEGGEIAWDFQSGTSMASPHVAGAMLLLKALRPHWSPLEIHSALMTTAINGVLREEDSQAATPFDIGAGRIDVSQAVRAGFVLDETDETFFAANPALGGEPHTLNLASLGQDFCFLDQCRWIRTLKGESQGAVTWSVNIDSPPGVIVSVEPHTFTLAPGTTREIEFFGLVTDQATPDEWAFGQAVFSPDINVPPAHLPIALKPAFSSLPDSVSVGSEQATGRYVIEGINTGIDVAALNIQVQGLSEGELMALELYQDPTPDSPQDGDGSAESGTFLSIVQVMEGDLRLLVHIGESSAPDLDLYIYDFSSRALVCSSTSPTSEEACEIENPDPGFYQVVVHNWAATDTSGNTPDSGELIIARVSGSDAENLTVSSQVGSPVRGEPFDLLLEWTIPTPENRYWFGRVSVGSDAETEGDLGFFEIDLTLDAAALDGELPQAECDLNGDRRWDWFDALLFKDICQGGEGAFACDLNEDGTFDGADVERFGQYCSSS
ncbi:MAG: S8 family serine peptidase [Magnetococcales bacterium]|nr:S8 family serine peptidase [Magnetococcales bacterium]